MKVKNVICSMLGVMLVCCLMLFTGCDSQKTTSSKTVDSSSGASASSSASNASSAAASTSAEPKEKPIIAVTIVPEETFVKAVCGDLDDVITMVPPGNSPENYEPTPEQMEKFSKASLYFSIGVPTEEANILPNVGDVKVVSLQGKVADVYPERKFESGERDPHIWLSPKRAEVMVATIAQELGKIDEANKDTYEKNAEAYINKLEDLDKEIKSSLEGVKSKKFIVYHPAFGYLADDYGLKMYALEDEGKEATPQHLQEMVDLAKKENIKVIFYQEEIDSSQSQSFAEEIGGKTIQLEPLAADYIDNLKRMAQTMAEAMQ
ncbi:MAG: zinc ABC transporter substrate-binding protein [Clostridia bacterium]|jgi:zinc transport system substrate-binding protein|nr:zinc ABC transporter substrate-binding protein [Clostridia bacterium]MCI2000517.1 zinc ABC transporter substrate-binding protein [Clostridia bacterium]MCI2014972.1 zinc ABC transporter substrate-binding protein [Clostridia bacterium]